MKTMKKILILFCVTTLTIFLTACTSEFDGSRTGNDSQFIMKYKVLNTTDSQDLELQSGDVINVQIVANGGTLAVKIQKNGEDPIYESDEILASDDFDIEIAESGTYTVTVTGKKAKGSVSFVVESGE